MAEVYGNLVIVVILVKEGVSRAALCPPTMPHRHALYDSRRVTRRYLGAAMMVPHRRCYRGGVRESDEDTEGVGVFALLVQGNWTLRCHTEMFW